MQQQLQQLLLPDGAAQGEEAVSSGTRGEALARDLGPGEQHVRAGHVSQDTCHADGGSQGAGTEPQGLGCRGGAAGHTNAYAHAHVHARACGHSHGHAQPSAHPHTHVQAHKHKEGHENGGHHAGHSPRHGHRDGEAERAPGATEPAGGPQQGPDGAATPSATALASCQGFAALLEHVTSGRFVAEVASPVGRGSGQRVGVVQRGLHGRHPAHSWVANFWKMLALQI